MANSGPTVVFDVATESKLDYPFDFYACAQLRQRSGIPIAMPVSASFLYTGPPEAKEPRAPVCVVNVACVVHCSRLQSNPERMCDRPAIYLWKPPLEFLVVL